MTAIKRKFLMPALMSAITAAALASCSTGGATEVAEGAVATDGTLESEGGPLRCARRASHHVGGRGAVAVRGRARSFRLGLADAGTGRVRRGKADRPLDTSDRIHHFQPAPEKM